MPLSTPHSGSSIVSAITRWIGDMDMAAAQESAVQIGQRLATLRKERGLTQTELAKALGLSQSMMSDYERGELRLHGELILQIVHILGISADDLFGLSDKGKPNGQSPQRATRNKQLLNRLHRIDDLPKRDRDALMRTIDAFLERAS